MRRIRLTQENVAYLRQLPMYQLLVWIARVFLFGFAAMFALALTGGGGQVAAGLFCLMAATALVFMTAVWLVTAHMAKTLGVRVAGSFLSNAVIMAALADSLRSKR